MQSYLMMYTPNTKRNAYHLKVAAALRPTLDASLPRFTGSGLPEPPALFANRASSSSSTKFSSFMVLSTAVRIRFLSMLIFNCQCLCFGCFRSRYCCRMRGRCRCWARSGQSCRAIRWTCSRRRRRLWSCFRERAWWTSIVIKCDNHIHKRSRRSKLDRDASALMIPISIAVGVCMTLYGSSIVENQTSRGDLVCGLSVLFVISFSKQVVSIP